MAYFSHPMLRSIANMRSDTFIIRELRKPNPKLSVVEAKRANKMKRKQTQTVMLRKELRDEKNLEKLTDKQLENMIERENQKNHIKTDDLLKNKNTVPPGVLLGIKKVVRLYNEHKRIKTRGIHNQLKPRDELIRMIRDLQIGRRGVFQSLGPLGNILQLVPNEYEEKTNFDVVETLIGHSKFVCCVAVTPDGRVVSGSRDNTVKVWSENTDGSGGWISATLSGRSKWVQCVAMLPDGRIVSGSRDNTVKVWRERFGVWTEEATLSGHSNWVNSVAVMPDGRIVSGSSDNTVKVWWERSSGWVDKDTLSEHSKWVTSVAVMPDGRIVSGSRDETVKVWRENKSGGGWAEDETLSGHSSVVSSVAVLASAGPRSSGLPGPNGVRIVSGSWDNTVKVWREDESGNGWAEKATLSGHISYVRSVAVMPDGRIVSGSVDRTVKVWREDESGGGWAEVATLSGHGKTVNSVAVMPDGRIVSGNNDKTVKVWG